MTNPQPQSPSAVLSPSRFAHDQHATDVEEHGCQGIREHARQGMHATRIEIHEMLCLLREECALGRMSERLFMQLVDDLQAKREHFHQHLHVLQNAHALRQH